MNSPLPRLWRRSTPGEGHGTATAAASRTLVLRRDDCALPERVRLGRLAFDRITLAEAVLCIDALVRARRAAFVVTPNVDHLVRAERDAEYRAIVARAELVLADGQPVVWASRLLGTPLPERVAGSDLFPRLCQHAAAVGYGVFFLGGAPGAAEGARDVLVACHPKLNVVGTYCPPMGFEHDAAERARILAAVRAAEPRLVFVGLGSPKQERWIVAHMPDYGPAVSIGVGISFSFVAGHVRRAPLWMRRCGLEWLHRLGMEPQRLWRRYLVDAGWLLWIVWRELRAAYGTQPSAIARRRTAQALAHELPAEPTSAG